MSVNICPITLNEIVNLATVQPCNHRFEQSAIDGWYARRVEANQSATCPSCRETITEIFYAVHNGSSQPNGGMQNNIEQPVNRGSGLVNRENVLVKDRHKANRYEQLENAARDFRDPVPVFDTMESCRTLVQGIQTKIKSADRFVLSPDELRVLAHVIRRLDLNGSNNLFNSAGRLDRLGLELTTVIREGEVVRSNEAVY